ncbi:hypothetical protein FCL49_15765 [Serratia proteamaculans]|uniref:hypothetical protein n=1 Tax=Serratia TaxID=613 RepID=UPI00157544EA|nr:MULTISPECIES: hypothetical protein [Serratia]NTX80033.1 hypothetical protein [Serratia proteamaculans]NTZ29544.1 hypothetical protein [Serratia proteamaculans]CAI1109965.1 Uncharacterised protein [Serratia quinivorans]
MMKNILFLFSVILFSPFVYAGATSGQIGVSLTITPKCSVHIDDSVPQVKCGATDNQPKVTRSRLLAEGENEPNQELVTVEW